MNTELGKFINTNCLLMACVMKLVKCDIRSVTFQVVEHVLGSLHLSGKYSAMPNTQLVLNLYTTH